MEFSGGGLRLRDRGLPGGYPTHVRKISLARAPMAGSSILNTLPAVDEYTITPAN